MGSKKGHATYSDFRVMLDKMGSEIDAICINTPTTRILQLP